MKLRELKEKVDFEFGRLKKHEDPVVMVVVKRPGHLGGTPCVEVDSVQGGGFDWDHGKFLIRTKQILKEVD